jgi:hypothetical protein
VAEYIQQIRRHRFMPHTNQSGNSQLGGLVGLAVVLGIGLFIYHAVSPDYSKPWFTGEQIVQACETPTDGTNSCYFLRANSDGTNFTSVNFSNGGYLASSDTNCYETVPDDINSSKRVCLVLDQDGNQWELMPQQTAQ